MFLSEGREFNSAPCHAEKNDDRTRLNVVEIALPSLLPSWSG